MADLDGNIRIGRSIPHMNEHRIAISYMLKVDWSGATKER
jgi:hypothetical protein